MSNMSYCRFQNTASDLAECLWDGDPMQSGAELEAAKDMLQLCREMVAKLEGMHLDSKTPCAGDWCDAITDGERLCADCQEERDSERDEDEEEEDED